MSYGEDPLYNIRASIGQDDISINDLFSGNLIANNPKLCEPNRDNRTYLSASMIFCFLYSSIIVSIYSFASVSDIVVVLPIAPRTTLTAFLMPIDIGRQSERISVHTDQAHNTFDKLDKRFKLVV